MEAWLRTIGKGTYPVLQARVYNLSYMQGFITCPDAERSRKRGV